MKMKDFVIQIQRGIEKKKDKNALQTYSSLACFGHLDSWVRCAVREQKKIRAKKKNLRGREREIRREEALTPQSTPGSDFFPAQISLRGPHDLNAWKRVIHHVC